MGIRNALDRREQSTWDEAICGACNMRNRYRLPEVARAAWGYFRKR